MTRKRGCTKPTPRTTTPATPPWKRAHGAARDVRLGPRARGQEPAQLDRAAAVARRAPDRRGRAAARAAARRAGRRDPRGDPAPRRARRRLPVLLAHEPRFDLPPRLRRIDPHGVRLRRRYDTPRFAPATGWLHMGPRGRAPRDARRAARRCRRSPRYRRRRAAETTSRRSGRLGDDVVLDRAALVRLAPLRSRRLLQEEPPLPSRQARLSRVHRPGLLGA